MGFIAHRDGLILHVSATLTVPLQAEVIFDQLRRFLVWRRGGLNDKTRRQRQRVLNGGADQDRTDDLYNAIVALSQLSYSPTLSASQVSKESSAARRIFRRFTKCWQDLFSKFLSDHRRLIRHARRLRQDHRRLRRDQKHLREYHRPDRYRHHHQDR